MTKESKYIGGELYSKNVAHQSILLGAKKEASDKKTGAKLAAPPARKTIIPGGPKTLFPKGKTLMPQQKTVASKKEGSPLITNETKIIPGGPTIVLVEQTRLGQQSAVPKKQPESATTAIGGYNQLAAAPPKTKQKSPLYYEQGGEAPAVPTYDDEEDWDEEDEGTEPEKDVTVTTTESEKPTPKKKSKQRVKGAKKKRKKIAGAKRPKKKVKAAEKEEAEEQAQAQPEIEEEQVEKEAPSPKVATQVLPASSPVTQTTATSTKTLASQKSQQTASVLLRMQSAALQQNVLKLKMAREIRGNTRVLVFAVCLTGFVLLLVIGGLTFVFAKSIEATTFNANTTTEVKPVSK